MLPKRRLAVIVPAFLVLVLGGWAGWNVLGEKQQPAVTRGTSESVEGVVLESSPEPVTVRVPLPEEVRGIYWTAVTAGSARADGLLAYMEEEELNAVVIDLKMDNGEVAFVTEDKTLWPYVQEDPGIADLDALLVKLAERNVYRIARIPVMRDGAFAINHPEFAMKRAGGAMWRDNIGSLWVDPAAPEVADYAIALAREAYERGFDEVQFDYVRFASDGAVNAIVYPVYDGVLSKEEVMRVFFDRVGAAMRESGIPVSYDLFGMTFWSTDDYNIGQRLIDVYPNADFVSPMVYPSHYPNGFEGFGNPALYPYEIVKKSLDKGAEQLEAELQILPEDSRAKFRPWLQAFDIGAVYESERMLEQIRAARDAGASGWILWNARNVYDPINLAELEQNAL
jgi:hypothetical protein